MYEDIVDDAFEFKFSRPSQEDMRIHENVYALNEYFSVMYVSKACVQTKKAYIKENAKNDIE